jgi:uncharacterized protein (DUF1015 family)
MWVVQKREAIMAFLEAVKPLTLTIADGHHRYETAVAFRDEMRRKTGKADGNQPFDYVMMYLTGSGEAGLVIKPIHRLFTRQMMAEVDLPQAMKDLAEHFIVRESKTDLTQSRAADKLTALLTGANGPKFVFVQPSGRTWTAELRAGVNPADLVDAQDMDDRLKSLDASILHHYIVSQVMVGNPEFEVEDDDCQYESDLERVVAALRDRKVGLAALMNPPKLSDVMDVASRGLRMPQRTTHFFPKPACGIVLRSMESDERLKGKKLLS